MQRHVHVGGRIGNRRGERKQEPKAGWRGRGGPEKKINPEKISYRAAK